MKFINIMQISEIDKKIKSISKFLNRCKINIYISLIVLSFKNQKFTKIIKEFKNIGDLI